jgi:muramoyltetrapeptide carboxypeptidase
VSTPHIGIAIVAPSGQTLDQAGLERGIARLEAQGCTVHNYFDTARVFQRFGDTDAGRLAQINAAAADPAVQVVMSLRGQYGLSRLMPQIDFDAMAASGKLFVGFSDSTAFQLGLYAKTGAKSYSGPMFFNDFMPEQLDDFTLGSFWNCLQGPVHRIAETVSGNPACDLQGTSWGGNLAMILSLIGTGYLPRVKDGILFIEDVNEHPYRVERMVLQLLQSGVLDQQKALILGDFSNYKLGPGDNGYDFDTMLAYLRATLPIPVLTGLRYGHGRTRVTIPIGASARLVSNAQGFELTLSDYPTVSHA